MILECQLEEAHSGIKQKQDYEAESLIRRQFLEFHAHVQDPPWATDSHINLSLKRYCYKHHCEIFVSKAALGGH